jgi:hypothetical protein
MLVSRLVDARRSHVNLFHTAWQGHAVLVHCRVQDGAHTAAGRELLSRWFGLCLCFGVQQAAEFIAGFFRVWHISSQD